MYTQGRELQESERPPGKSVCDVELLYILYADIILYMLRLDDMAVMEVLPR
jgi:hypothetical protein